MTTTQLEKKKEMTVGMNNLIADLENLITVYPHLEGQSWIDKTLASLEEKGEWSQEQADRLLILNALEKITADTPDWTYIAAQIHTWSLYREAAANRGGNPEQGYGDFPGLVRKLTERGIFSSLLKDNYTVAEMRELEEVIAPERDGLFTYVGLRTLADRYLTRDHEGGVWELPQERFLIIAMTLMSQEAKEQRLTLVKEAYWALSNLYMTVATPTFANAGKNYGQLSSCFIDTIDDSLRGIYDSNTDVATLSKGGGGIGIYLGKIRSRGSDIKGFKGISSGVLPWMKQLNNTAVSVDQLGQRQGSIAVYLDVWHKDIFSFLDAKLNNGDERLRTHDIFTGLCLPDLFMETVEARGEWHLFDPHEVRRTMGYSLEDFYDEEKGAGSFRERYAECVNHPTLSRKTVPAIEIMKRAMISQLETGTPYMFYRDEVNRMNPNKHAGMIYSSNLCSEILQNQSATTVTEETTVDGKIVVTKAPGDFVVCNLSSINLGRAVPDGVLERLIPVQVRMLDNVIDLNTIEVLQAKMTNQKYRAIGLGTFGWHHLLALEGITWESDESVAYADELYEKIAHLVIRSSHELAVEKGAYPVFSGSEWETGAYFDSRGYHGESWDELRKSIATKGIRNGWLMAIAPNGSTSVIAGSTASIDPVYRKEYSEEKKNYRIPVTAPDLSPKTTWYYKPAHQIDAHWSIKQNAARQRHIDQSQSFNIYVTHDVKAKDLLDIHLHAWNLGLKTTYYTRSTSSEIVECESCSS
ncbi:ribonucleoside-diphosphate reductase alpha chain [Marininema mesophilum]|uniref:Ribonucleoside-diphosphate reductase n=1 Tax=Marininema mesophilum TaxID=1048340 RepID=A0A1H2WZD3_9BACL|nr:ribonucleoside-diphosphate reductase subunit alpha [Marininema mesophilum]SDW85878.1 ribonucleoside-diphosphate reductase alpha chain [Marininema mesophilum]